MNIYFLYWDNFGGSLTLIFLIISLLIFAYYLIVYITEDNYSIQYIFHEKYISDEETNQRMNDNQYNPYFDFKFDLQIYKEIKLSADFILANVTNADLDNLKKVPRNALLYNRVTDIDLDILYKCNETNINCTPPYEVFFFCPKFIGFILDHQNSKSPLHKMEVGYFSEKISFLTNEPGEITYKWRNIKYNPEAGLKKLWNDLSSIDAEKQKYIGLRAIDSKFVSYKNLFENTYSPIINVNRTKYRVLGRIKFEIDFDHYDEYTRTKKSFLDLISNVFSLSLGVFNALSSFLAVFYSSNFDNYKIIEKILFDIKPENREK